MAIISPVSDDIQHNIIPVDRAKAVLNRAGLGELTSVRNDVIDALNASGADVASCATSLASLISYADRDVVKYKATCEALKLHGAYGEMAGDDGKIVFMIEGNVQVNQVFNPQRARYVRKELEDNE